VVYGLVRPDIGRESMLAATGRQSGQAGPRRIIAAVTNRGIFFRVPIVRVTVESGNCSGILLAFRLQLSLQG